MLFPNGFATKPAPDWHSYISLWRFSMRNIIYKWVFFLCCKTTVSSVLLPIVFILAWMCTESGSRKRESAAIQLPQDGCDALIIVTLHSQPHNAAANILTVLFSFLILNSATNASQQSCSSVWCRPVVSSCQAIDYRQQQWLPGAVRGTVRLLGSGYEHGFALIAFSHDIREKTLLEHQKMVNNWEQLKKNQ